MKNLLSFKFWLNSNPPDLIPIFYKAFIIIIFLFFLSYLVAFFLQRKKKGAYNNALQSVKSMTLANFILGLILLFFNYESIYFLSARFWFLLWGAEIIAWLYFVIMKFRIIPEKIEAKIKENEYKKYLPK